MSQTPSGSAAPALEAILKIGPEFVEHLVNQLRPVVNEAVIDGLASLSPPTSRSWGNGPPHATSLPTKVGVETTGSGRGKAMAAKTEPSDATHEADNRFLIDIRTVSHLLDVSTRTVHRFASAGILPSPTKVGRMIRWRADEIKAWANAGCPRKGDWRWPQSDVPPSATRRPRR